MKHLTYQLRPATTEDAEKLLEIYTQYVTNTPISFETEVPSLPEFTNRVANYGTKWGWLVAEAAGTIAGYAYGSAHRPRSAYRYSVEVSAYMDPAYQRQGIAGKLYQQLFQTLKNRGYANAYAAVTIPNEASIQFHHSQGFIDIGIFPNVGYKFDQWHSVAWLYKSLKS